MHIQPKKKFTNVSAVNRIPVFSVIEQITTKKNGVIKNAIVAIIIIDNRRPKTACA